MIRIKMSYKNEHERLRILQQLSKGNIIKKIEGPYKKGEFSRVYIEIE